MKKLNNMNITRLTRNKQSNILRNFSRFNTFVNEKMLGNKFKSWPVNSFFNVIFIIIDMHITYLSNVEAKLPHSTKLSDDNTKKFQKMLVRLDTAAIILEICNQNLLNLINFLAKQVNKKIEKAKKY